MTTPREALIALADKFERLHNDAERLKALVASNDDAFAILNRQLDEQGEAIEALQTRLTALEPETPNQ